jgi:GT2 family glycosyltransferase
MRSNQGLGAALAVVVVYRRAWRDVRAWAVLEDVLQAKEGPVEGALPGLGQLLIYDNSPVPIGQPEARLVNSHYVHDPSNGGTRAAYLRALQLALDSRLPWLILLDQDTKLSPEYLAELDRRLAQAWDPKLGLLFPRIVGGDGALSPACISRWGTVVPIAPRQQHLSTERHCELTAVASGAAIRTDALVAVGDIPSQLWLDYLDHWLFREVQRRGYRAERLSATLEHDLSIRSSSLPGDERQRNILRAERYFTGTLGAGARLAYPFRLLRRALRVLPRDASAARVILRHALQGWPGK